MSAELESCPACGALPCDWVDNPHSRIHAYLDERGAPLNWDVGDGQLHPMSIIERLTALTTTQPIMEAISALRRRYDRRAREIALSRNERTRCSHYVQVLDELLSSLSFQSTDRGEGEGVIASRPAA